MPTAFPHLQPRIGQDLWLPIGEDSTSTGTFYSDGITTSRVEEPLNFPDPNAVDQQENLALFTPAYSQLRNANRPEITRFVCTEEEALPESMVLTECRGGGQLAANSNLSNLNDIQHELDGRLSSVPHYPVYLEAPARYPTRPRSRSPASIASSSTTAALISVGQLPGFEPFDPSSPPIHMYQSDYSSISSPTVQPQPSPVNSVRAEATISGPLVTQPASVGGHMSTVSQISWLWDDLSQEYWAPPERGYYAPEPPEARSNFRHTIYWSNRRDSRDLVPSCRSFQRPDSPDPDYPPPPPPPPKDPGYEARPRNNGRNRYLDRFRTGHLRRRKDR